MCGILGYVGPRKAEPILVDGLRRLEYRGYDSAGLATLVGDRMHLRKRAGRVSDLSSFLQTSPAPGSIGISHTRWATHGPANDINAHPHVAGDGDGAVAVVHNGVIENYAVLKKHLQSEGIEFKSQTDTEVIAQLIAYHLNGDLVEAVRKVLGLLKGTYGLAVISPKNPHIVVGARLGSPLVVGIGDGEHYLASDPSALSGNTQKVVFLQDHQLCVLTANDWHVYDSDHSRVSALVHSIDADPAETDIGGFPHFMLKEIYEQPDSIENALRGRLSDADASAHFGGLNIDPQQLRRAERIILTACGTSYHAAIVGEYLFRRGSPASRSKSNTPASSDIAIRRSINTPLSSRLRSRARRRIRWPRCASRNAKAIPCCPFAMSSAARSPARPTAAFICTPGRKSASPAPRPSRRRSPC